MELPVTMTNIDQRPQPRLDKTLAAAVPHPLAVPTNGTSGQHTRPPLKILVIPDAWIQLYNSLY